MLADLFTQLNLVFAVFSLLFFTTLLIASVFLEGVILKGNSLATPRRLLAVAFLSNGVWLVVIVLGFGVTWLLTGQQQYVVFAVLGMLYAVGFRLFVFRSVFFHRMVPSILMALTQPFLLGATALTLPRLLTTLLEEPIVLGVGVVAVTVVAGYVSLVNRAGRGYMETQPLVILKAFLQAWATNQPEAFEQIAERSSATANIKTFALTFESNHVKPALVLPEVHPGPFYPIGSSNLPYLLHKWFKSRDFSPLILHSISGHELNLPSKAEVEKYLASLTGLSHIYTANTCSPPVTVTVGKGTVSGIAFGDCAITMLTLAPYGAEDFPSYIKDRIEDYGASLGFQHIFVVDSHNSEGEIPSPQDCEDILRAAAETLKSLRSRQQAGFKVGVAHSSEADFDFQRDIGPAGISTLILEAAGQKHVLAGVDANNALKGVREAVADHLKATATPLLELCTSDTHITAGKSMDVKGYFALGELTNKDKITRAIVQIAAIAEQRLAPATMTVRSVETAVKVVGVELLDTFSAGMDRVVRRARRGGFLVCITSLLLIVAAAVLRVVL